jgi:hypothetical protein
MNQFSRLQEERERLVAVKKGLNCKAPMDTVVGMLYVRSLVKLAMIEIQLEALQKKKAAH